MDNENTYLRSLHGGEEELSKRELFVLRLAAAGLSNKQIAGKICRCVKQVEHDVAEIIYKLHAQNMKNAIDLAWRKGILKKEE